MSHFTRCRPVPFFPAAVVALVMALVLPMRTAHATQGSIGLGTWATQAEFKDIKVTQGDRALFASDFSNGLDGWQRVRGTWDVVDGALRQTSNEENTRITVGDPSWADYTITLKARKISGDEGFLISFGLLDADDKSWWNIGGWGDTRHGIEAPGVSADQVPGKIETGRWYDIRIELTANTIKTYLDNQLIQSATQKAAQKDFGRPIIPDLIADPSVVNEDGMFYCYATTDGSGAGLATSGVPVVWKSRDFVTWSFKGTIFPSNFDAKYWAPSSLIHRNGRYYLFPTLNNKITAVVADSPDGPFRALDGKDITSGSDWKPFTITVGNPIDAEVFVDDDDAAYMVWSQRGIGKLKSDLSEFDGPQWTIQTKRAGYSEGPYLFKRSGIYYYCYTLEGYENYKYAYVMSRSLKGPWQAPADDIIAKTDGQQGIYGPGHGCFFSPKGSNQWYFVYLEYGRGGTNRQVFADKMNFNADGTIQPIRLTPGGVGSLRPDAVEKEVNLAIGKTATASSSLPDYRVPIHSDPSLNRIENYSPANAIDNSNGSRWIAADTDKAPWFQLDLGRPTDIHRTELYFVLPTVGQAYRLETSLDGKSWEPYGGHGEVIAQSPHTDTKSANVRYLRLTVLKGNAGLWEFKVY